MLLWLFCSTVMDKWDIFRASHVADALPCSGPFRLYLHDPVQPSCCCFSVCTAASRHGNGTMISLIYSSQRYLLSRLLAVEQCVFFNDASIFDLIGAGWILIVANGNYPPPPPSRVLLLLNVLLEPFWLWPEGIITPSGFIHSSFAVSPCFPNSCVHVSRVYAPVCQVGLQSTGSISGLIICLTVSLKNSSWFEIWAGDFQTFHVVHPAGLELVNWWQYFLQ